MTTILLTGFGPFPGAPFNPTAALVARLKRRRPALGDARLIAHVFATSYAAVDRELPALLARHRPDALLMFGLAPRTPQLRIETRARNAVAGMADAERRAPSGHAIELQQPAVRTLRVPAHRLLAAARAARVPARLSHDAGKYLCNYLCWRAVEAADQRSPRMVAFVHVPNLRRTARRHAKRRRLTLDDLVRAGGAMLVALAAAARRGLPIVNDRKQ
jgi:pyroglutamyl-peptidase